MNKRLVLEPTLSGSDIIVQFTDRVPLAKTVFVRVPNDFSAFIGIDEKFVARLSSCKETSLLEYLGKKEKGKMVQLAFLEKEKFRHRRGALGMLLFCLMTRLFTLERMGVFKLKW